MTKLQLLFLIVFAGAAYVCDVYSTPMVGTFEEKREYYFQILLKKWQKSAGADWQEQKLLGWDEGPGRYFTPAKERAREKTLEILRSDFGITRKVMMHVHTRHGEYFDYHITWPRGEPAPFEELWFLFLGDDAKLLSMHRDSSTTFRIIRPPISPAVPTVPTAEDTLVWEIARRKDAERHYTDLLQQWGSDSAAGNFLRMPTCFSGNNNFVTTTDSVAATNIAAAAARKHYGPLLRDCDSIVAFGAKLMGGDEEHWMVYSILGYKQCIAGKNENRSCYRIVMRYHEKGQTPQSWSLDCPPILRILIAKKNGQVLSILPPINDVRTRPVWRK